MRFVSQYPGYGAQIRVQRQRAIDGGGIEVLQPGLYVQFAAVHSGGMLYDNERTAALEHFRFRGNTQDIGEAVPTDPLQRLSVFDTDEAAQNEDWSDADKALVEARLQEIAFSTPEELILVADTPISRPFPKYDDWEGEAPLLVARLIEDGHNIEEVLHYERVFGPQRPDVIEALEYAVELSREQTVTA